MNNEILVSISCLTYNHAPYVRQCLEGFLMQKTDFKYEILIHDDASTDGTTEIIKKYETKFPDIMKPLYEDENQWIKGRRGSTVFNYPRAKGKYIALCEGDDYWIDPLKLQKQVDFLEQYPEYGLVFTDFNVQREKQKMILGIFKNKILPVYTTFEEHLINAGFLAPCTWVLRKELIARQNFGYAVDGSFILMLDTMQQTSVYFMEETTAVYRVLKESVSHSVDYRKYYLFAKGVYKIQKDYCRFYKCADSIKDKIDLQYYNAFLPYILINDDYEEAQAAREYLKGKKSLSIKTKISLLISKNKFIISLLRFMYKYKKIFKFLFRINNRKQVL